MKYNTKDYKIWVEISRINLVHNIKEFRTFISQEIAIMAIVKANAYGHGLRETAQALAQFPHLFLGVDSLEEALALRKVAMNPIMILGYVPKSKIGSALKTGFHISVYSPELLAEIPHIIRTQRISVNQIHIHLKIETGTNRLGIRLDELQRAHISFPIEGIYTHFADSENVRSTFMQAQEKKLEEARAILKKKGIVSRFIHSACTAAAMRKGNSSSNLARIGIGLYGLWPSEELEKRLSKKLKLLPVLSWKTRIAQVKRVTQGETVGYDRTWKATRDTRIAILPVGYADGYDRGLSHRGEVLIHGTRAPIIGHICMNMMMVDLKNIPTKVSDEVILLGKSGNQKLTADDLAKKIGTINYEVVARINPLLPRVIR